MYENPFINQHIKDHFVEYCFISLTILLLFLVKLFNYAETVNWFLSDYGCKNDYTFNIKEEAEVTRK